MSPESFTYWLQGFFELSRVQGVKIDDPLLLAIEDHLKLVFKKETPDRTALSEEDIKNIRERFKTDDGKVPLFPYFSPPLPDMPNYAGWTPPNPYWGKTIIC